MYIMTGSKLKSQLFHPLHSDKQPEDTIVHNNRFKIKITVVPSFNSFRNTTWSDKRNCIRPCQEYLETSTSLSHIMERNEYEIRKRDSDGLMDWQLALLLINEGALELRERWNWNKYKHEYWKRKKKIKTENAYLECDGKSLVGSPMTG